MIFGSVALSAAAATEPSESYNPGHLTGFESSVQLADLYPGGDLMASQGPVEFLLFNSIALQLTNEPASMESDEKELEAIADMEPAEFQPVAVIEPDELEPVIVPELEEFEIQSQLVGFRTSVELADFDDVDDAMAGQAMVSSLSFNPLAVQVSAEPAAEDLETAEVIAEPAGFENAGDPDVYIVADNDTDAGGDPDEFEKAEEAVKDGTGEAIEGVKLGAAETTAAADGAADSPSLLESVASAMRPEGGIPPLLNDRLSVYLSDRVIFVNFERNAARYDLEQARASIGFMFTEERDTVFEFGLALDAPGTLTENMRLSVGTKAYVALIGRENNDAFAAGFGLEAAYVLPSEKLPLELGASFYYAPDVLTFGQGDRVVDWLLQVTMPFRPGLSLFAGIRYLQVDTRPGDREIDNRVHFGVRWDLE